MKISNIVISITVAMLSALSGSFHTSAETVSRKEASRMAHTFFNAAYGEVVAKPNLVYNGKKLTTDRLFSPYYIYNQPRGGFVIISADNKAMPVLGYSLRGSFDPERMDSVTQELLTDYARDIEYVRYDPRLPVEAIAAWNYFRDYLGDVLTGRYDLSDFRYEPDGHPDWRMRKFATEFTDLDERVDDSDMSEEEEKDRPFALYDDFVAETRAEELQRQAMFEERLHPTKPVVRSVGGGHFEIILPEDVVMARVYNLEGAQVETRTFRGTQTAVISLDAEPKGFYFVILNGESGKHYGVKLWK